jgi:hypothetical protein
MQNTKTMPKTKNQLKSNIEICNECGRGVGFGSGLFINRIVDLGDYKTRKMMNKPFPKGEYICRECEEKVK